MNGRLRSARPRLMLQHHLETASFRHDANGTRQRQNNAGLSATKIAAKDFTSKLVAAEGAKISHPLGGSENVRGSASFCNASLMRSTNYRSASLFSMELRRSAKGRPRSVLSIGR